ERQAWQDKITLLQEVTAGFQAQYQRMADAGVITFTEAQAKIAAQQAKVLAAQQQAIEAQLGQVAPDTEAARQLQAQLNLIKQKTENFNQQPAVAAEDANRRDYERNASHAVRIRSIDEQIEDIQRASQQAQLKALENAGVRREGIWNRQMQFDLQAEQIATSRRVAELQRERAYVEQFEQNEQRRADILAAIDREIAAIEQAGSVRRGAIIEEFTQKQRERLKDWADKAVDIFDKAMGRFKQEGWSGFFKSIGESFRDLLKQMATDLLRSSIYKLLLSVFKIPVSSPQLAVAGAGATAGTGATGALGAIAGQALGGGNAGGFLTGGFAGGNPAAAALGGGSGTANILGSVLNSAPGAKGLGGLLSKIPLIGGLFGGGKKPVGPEMIGGLPVFRNKFPVQ